MMSPTGASFPGMGATDAGNSGPDPTLRAEADRNRYTAAI
jgi:hypothetical protein